MTEIEKKIIEFLLSAAVYSKTAITKNLGIDENKLEIYLENLEKKGYLESYDTFLKREQLNESECCKTKNKSTCSGCVSSNCSSQKNCCSTNIFSNLKDYSNIKILTDKAFEEFYN